MIVISAVLVIVGAALLVAGLIASGLTLIYISLGVTVLAAILLLLGVFRSGRGDTVAEQGAGAVASSNPPAVTAAPVAREAVTDPDRVASEPEPAYEPEGDSVGTVVVVSGRPRYHVSGCRFLTGRDEAEDISVEEARELGFTPCGACKPDDHLDRPEPAAEQPPAEQPTEPTEPTEPTGPTEPTEPVEPLTQPITVPVVDDEPIVAADDRASEGADDAVDEQPPAEAPVRATGRRTAPARRAAADRTRARSALSTDPETTAAAEPTIKRAAAAATQSAVTRSPAKRTAAKATAARTTPAKQTATRATAKKAAAKPATKKAAAATTAKKTAAKSTAAKATATKKTTGAKKTAANKVVAKRAGTKRTDG